MNRYLPLVLIVLMLGLFYIGVTGGPGNDIDSLSNQANTPDNGEPQGDAPNFTGTTIDGGTIELASYRGEKAVVLDFWASWCPNCRRSMPKINELYTQYRDQVEVIGVNLRESSDVATDFMRDNGFEFTSVLDSDGSIAQQFGVTYTNYHVLIDKNGQIVNTFAGDIADRHFEQLVEQS